MATATVPAPATVSAIIAVPISVPISVPVSPSAPVRETLHCPHCGLNQFVRSDRRCRRPGCHKPLDQPVDTAANSVPEPPPIPISIVPPASPHRLFHDAKRTLPFVLLWFRLRAGLSQPQLGRLLGVPRTYVSKLENGKATPTVASLIKVAEGLGTTVGKVLVACEYLMEGSGQDDKL